MKKALQTKFSIIIKQKPDFCTDGSKNFIQKILVFRFQEKSYIAIARPSGLIQLYEDRIWDIDAPNGYNYTPRTHETVSKRRQKDYKLFKEWKNSNNSFQDEVVSLGFINDQYLYSCSVEGKLILRDLINDDADESYKVYIIQGPVSTVELRLIDKFKIKIISGGKNNELKIYEAELNHSSPNLLASINEDIRILSSELRSTINLTYETPEPSRSLRRAPNLRNTNVINEASLGISGSIPRLQLIPVFISLSRTQDYIYKASYNVITNWIVSICYIDNIGNELVACGSQFGNLVIYDTNHDDYPLKTLHLSQFPIISLTCFNNNRYLLYSDTMSKVGIVDINSFEVVNFYDQLKFGPVMSMKLVTNIDSSSKLSKFNRVSKFDPIFLIASTIDKKLLIYKLNDNNSAELKLNIQTDSLIPSIEILDHSPYIALMKVFNDFDKDFVNEKETSDVADTVHCSPSNSHKKRRLTRLARLTHQEIPLTNIRYPERQEQLTDKKKLVGCKERSQQ